MTILCYNIHSAKKCVLSALFPCMVSGWGLTLYNQQIPKFRTLVGDLAQLSFCSLLCVISRADVTGATAKDEVFEGVNRLLVVGTGYLELCRLC